MSSKPKNAGYTTTNIASLTPREHIRRRPGMYVGGTDIRALHHLIWEVVDNSLDEAMAGRCSDIRIVLHSDTKVSVIDNGRGIPVKLHENGKSYLELCLTEIGGGTFDNQSYKVSGGLHGVGLSAVNALSSEMIAEVRRDGYLWRQTYSRGLPTCEVQQIRALTDGESTGTSITFTPDFTIMEANVFDYNLIIERCRELAYLQPDVTFHIERDGHPEHTVVLGKPHGLADWVADMNVDFDVIHPLFQTSYKASHEGYAGDDIHVEIHLAFQFRSQTIGKIKSFVNTVELSDGGSHVAGLKRALVSELCKDDIPASVDPLQGLVACIHVLHEDPHFQSNARVKLLNAELHYIMANCIRELFAKNAEIHAQMQEYFRV